jgi:acetyl esterase/lipase
VAFALREVLRATLRPTFTADRPIPDQRLRLARIARLTWPARGVQLTPCAFGGVPGELARPPGDAAPHVLYLHGGAYCVGSPATHRSITTHLARFASAQVFAADYHLAPEFPFPAAVDDAVAAYRGLRAAGIACEKLALAGDSAGGGLALATALRLRELGEPGPAALVLFSPWVDLGQPDRGPPPRGEVMVSLPWIEQCARHYLAGRDAGESLASPINGDLRGLPPVLVQVGRDELLLQDSRRLHAALLAANVEVSLQEFPRRWHVFQSNAGMLADADRALRSAAQFMRKRWER